MRFLVYDAYALATLCAFNVLSARAEMRTLVGFPSTMIVAFCKFTFHLRRVARNECERLLPLKAFLPVMAQTLDTLQTLPSSNA